MAVAGIICEYNPFHPGHLGHIERTRALLGGDCGVVCVMSGNFVQRGDFAVFNKHARAKSAVLCGADLVLELPAPYALSSSERFADAGVYILDSIGICGHISFGSEAGDIGVIREAAEKIVTPGADAITKDWLDKGLPYAAARQKAADAVMGERSEVFKSPNNLLGIEYLKAIYALNSPIQPVTIKRTGGEHDGGTGYSASALRNALSRGESPWACVSEKAAEVYSSEIAQGRGPVSMKRCELAILSRLRALRGFEQFQGATEGLEHRLMRYAASEPTVEAILEKVKTKRYAMSRLRRMLMCACLDITAADTLDPPPYIRVLAMNGTGMRLLATARKKTRLPIITKPATVKRLSPRAAEIFTKESRATDLYALAYPEESNRAGGQEWRLSPSIVGV